MAFLSPFEYLPNYGHISLWRIEGLHELGTRTGVHQPRGIDSSTLFVELMRSLADGVPFQGRAVFPPTGRIAYWNLDMPAAQMRSLVEQVGIENRSRIVIANLCNKTVPLHSEEIVDRVIHWMRQNAIECWIIDPVNCLYDGVVNQGSVFDAQAVREWTLDRLTKPTQPKRGDIDDPVVSELTSRLDCIKEAAGIVDLWYSLRTPN
jgi:hypothetical protein